MRDVLATYTKFQPPLDNVLFSMLTTKADCLKMTKFQPPEPNSSRVSPNSSHSLQQPKYTEIMNTFIRH